MVLGGARGHSAGGRPEKDEEAPTGRASWEERGRLREGGRRWAGPPFPWTLRVLRSDVARAPLVLVVAAGALIRSRSLLFPLPRGPYRAPWPSRRPMSARMTASRSTATSFAPTCSGEGLVRACGRERGQEQGTPETRPGTGGAWGVGPGVRGVQVLWNLDLCPVESTFCLAWPVLVDIANGNSGRVELVCFENIPH